VRVSSAMIFPYFHIFHLSPNSDKKMEMFNGVVKIRRDQQDRVGDKT